MRIRSPFLHESVQEMISVAVCDLPLDRECVHGVLDTHLFATLTYTVRCILIYCVLPCNLIWKLICSYNK